MSPVTTRSWLPANERWHRSRASCTQPSGCAPYPTRSPRHQISSTPSLSTSARTASKAGRFPWTSESRAMRIWGVLQCRRMRRSRLPLAFVVAVAAAAVATFLLRPRSGLIEPAPVEVQHYFTSEQLERAEDFRSLQRILGLAGLGIGIGTLALLAWRPPRGLLGRLSARPLLGAAAAGAGISLLLV